MRSRGERQELRLGLARRVREREIRHRNHRPRRRGIREVVRRISVDEIIAANPTIDILQIRQNDDNWGNGNPRNRSEAWANDPMHLNDIESYRQAMPIVSRASPPAICS